MYSGNLCARKRLVCSSEDLVYLVPVPAPHVDIVVGTGARELERWLTDNRESCEVESLVLNDGAFSPDRLDVEIGDGNALEVELHGVVMSAGIFEDVYGHCVDAIRGESRVLSPSPLDLESLVVAPDLPLFGEEYVDDIKGVELKVNAFDDTAGAKSSFGGPSFGGPSFGGSYTVNYARNDALYGEDSGMHMDEFNANFNADFRASFHANARTGSYVDHICTEPIQEALPSLAVLGLASARQAILQRVGPVDFHPMTSDEYFAKFRRTALPCMDAPWRWDSAQNRLRKKRGPYIKSPKQKQKEAHRLSAKSKGC